MAKNLKSITGSTLVLSEPAPADVELQVAKDAVVTLNGQKVALANLKPGDVIQPSGENPVKTIVASRA